MSHKLDLVITLLDEMNARLNRIEQLLEFDDDIPLAIITKVEPKLTVVETKPTNIIEFKND
jgi:hypothetical protein|tara:strand:+ start:5352 stop:5534 length:183 start_codon:yes stop_codon:yes gene_type:complete